MERNHNALEEQRLFEAYNTGTLINELFDHPGSSDENDSASTPATLIQLHNTGKIDLLSLANTSEFGAITGFQFFTGQHFFCKVIPKLNATIWQMMSFVQQLVEKGGQDLAANRPNVAFQEWCTADLTRAQGIIDAAKESENLSCEFLVFAMVAKGDSEDAKAFANSYEGTRRVAGVVALGRISHGNPIVAHDALRTLLGVLDKTPDDQLCANILMAALHLAKGTDQIGCWELLSITRKVSAAAGPLVRNSIAHGLLQYGRFLEDAHVAVLLDALTSVDPSHKGTLRDIDFALGELLDGGHADRAIHFTETLLARADNCLTLVDFDHFARRLVEGPADRFHRVLVSWLVSGTPVLCEGLAPLLRGRSPENAILEIDVSYLTQNARILFCRRATAYFFFEPIAAASLLVSSIRSGDDALSASALLFEPILLNYGGAVADYLRTIPPADSAYPRIEGVLTLYTKYLTSLQSTTAINELHPPEHHIRAAHMLMNDTMQRSLKEAERESVLLSIVSRSTVLYGKRTMTFRRGPSGNDTPTEMDLKSISSTIEWPRMDAIDPVGLDYMLRALKLGRPAK